MDESERRSPSSLLLAILALFGLASIRTFTGSPPRPDSAAQTKGEAKAAPGGARPRRGDRAGGATPDARILAPLLDSYRTGTDRDGSRDLAFERSQVDGLLFLVATVPDPVQSTNSHRFDEWIGAIQRACESEGFVLAGFRLPWEAGENPANDPDRGGPEPAAAGRGPAASHPTRDPGLLLFRGDKTPGPIKMMPLLAVLLVPETPTFGLDDVAMGRGLDLAATWDVRNRSGGGAKTFNILGPSFSGSQTSMEQALAGWTSRGDAFKAVAGVASAVAVPPATFEIISGGASAIRVESLVACVRPPHRVKFSATIYRNQVLLDALLGYLGESSGEIAMLVESNTGFGRQSQLDDNPTAKLRRVGHRLIYYPFPLHISKVRGYYQKRGYMRDQASQAVQSSERLPIPFEEAGDVTDIPTMQTPGFTTAVDELVLDQILADISHRGIRTVGIIATDPLDVIFLAWKVGQFLPDVRLFTTEPHLVFVHPQNVDALRGMLVASTYPLFPPNQSWSYSYRGDATHVLFSSEDVQGTYNAAIAHLEELGDPRIPARFLEYGTPFDPPGSYGAAPAGNGVPPWVDKRRTPPVWIGMVGNHGIYPVQVVTGSAEPKSDYLYVRQQKKEEYSDVLGLPTPAPGPPTPAQFEQQADSWRRIRGWFRPQLQRAWPFLFAGASLVCLAWAALGALVYRWAIAGTDGRHGEGLRLGRFAVVPLAQFLNCDRAEDAARPGDCRGPGPYLPIALALLLVVYLAIVAPQLEVLWLVPWVALNPLEPVEFWVTVVACAVTWSLLAALVLSLVARRPAARAARPAWVLPFLIVLAVVVASPLLLGIFKEVRQVRVAYAFANLDDGPRDALLRLARWVAIPSGVSPVLSMLFIGAAGLAWVYSQLKRRFLTDQFTPDSPPPEVAETVAPGDAATMRAIRHERDAIDDILTWHARPFLTTSIVGSIALAGFVWLFAVPVALQSLSRSALKDVGSLFEAVAGLLIALISGVLGFHTLQLIVLWRRVRKVLSLVLRLPMVAALDRIPSRVAAWFKESPRSGDNRLELIRRQTLALARHGEADGGAVREELGKALGRDLDATSWEQLNRDLSGSEPQAFAAAVLTVRNYWLEYWKTRAVAAAFPNAADRASEAGGEGGISDERHAIATASSRAADVPPPEAPERLPEWIRLAEDLLAMFFLRWLAPSLAQVWTLVGFLVVGSVALLLAISSYPFRFQDRMLLGMGLLTGALVLMILAIVVGFNRDELISRLSNTAPNRLKLDHHLLGGLLTYVIPLVGALAAISPDVSDTLRSLLDPILRHLR